MPGHGTSIEGMLKTARETLPGSAIPRLLLPEKARDPVFIYQRFPEDKTPAGRSFTTLDSKTGAVLSIGSSRTAPFLHTVLVQWTREIHTGTVLGLRSQIVASFFGLMLSVLAITGPVIWMTRQWAQVKARRAVLRRDRERALSETAGKP